MNRTTFDTYRIRISNIETITEFEILCDDVQGLRDEDHISQKEYELLIELAFAKEGSLVADPIDSYDAPEYYHRSYTRLEMDEFNKR